MASGLGVETSDQLVPFHHSASVWLCGPSVESPTAMHPFELGQDTLWSTLSMPALLGLGTIDQLLPFHDSTSELPVGCPVE